MKPGVLRENLFARRRAGVLLPIRSLPDGPGNGDIGHTAERFIDFAASCGWSIWQVLPIGPPDTSGSPYLAKSSSAGDPALIGLDRLVEWGWIDGFHSDLADPDPARIHRQERLSAAYRGFRNQADQAWQERFSDFCRRCDWLEDYALFSAIDEQEAGASWIFWPEPLRNRAPDALEEIRRRHALRMDEICFEQFLFATQWEMLREYADRKKISLLGDLPMFVAHHSADVWAHRELFRLHANGLPAVVAGVPPDYFSVDGQLWGNPLYDWDRLTDLGFRWWIDRVRIQIERFDALRLDHFRGLEACWEIPAEALTARAGRWVKAPGVELLSALQHVLGPLPLIAEDLGVITPEVTALREHFDLPGMRVLQFAFDGMPENPHLPHNHAPHTVVYTGTHDNPPAAVWATSLDDVTRERLNEYCGRASESIAWTLVLAALASVARIAIIPVQDWLELGEGNRVNVPGTSSGNWRWRFQWGSIPDGFSSRSNRWVRFFNR